MMLPILIVSAVAFGAKGDGRADDGPAIRAAVAAAADDPDRAVFLPPGTYVVGRAGSAYYGIRLDGVSLVGAGRDLTTIRQEARIGASVRTLYATGDGVAVEDLTLDGSGNDKDPSEHRHGIFAAESTGLVVRRVTARRYTGDGFYLFNGATASTFEDVDALDNHRNGITFGANVAGVTVRRSRFAGNRVQQVDSEPGMGGVVADVDIRWSVIDGSGSNDYAVTMSGTAASRARGWRLVGNQILGAVFVVWAHDVLIAGNQIDNHTTKPGVDINRDSVDVRVVGNDVTCTQVLAPSVAAVYVVGTSGSGPARVLVSANRLRVAHPAAMGVRVEGAVSVAIIGNDAAGGAIGIYLRATVAARDFELATVLDNRASPVLVQGNGAARMLRLVAERSGPVAVSPGVVVLAEVTP